MTKRPPGTVKTDDHLAFLLEEANDEPFPVYFVSSEGVIWRVQLTSKTRVDKNKNLHTGKQVMSLRSFGVFAHDRVPHPVGGFQGGGGGSSHGFVFEHHLLAAQFSAVVRRAKGRSGGVGHGEEA